MLNTYKYCEPWAAFLCKNMSPLGVIIFLTVFGFIVGHITYKFFNSFTIGKFLIYLNWLFLPGSLLIIFAFK